LVYLLAITFPGLIDKAAFLAGFAPSTNSELIKNKPLDGKHFFVGQGSRDDIVSVEQSKLMVNLLERAGAQITYCEDDVGHKVSSDCLRALKRYLAD
jgi:predicted esterase